MRAAVIGQGAIGTVLARALRGHVELILVDRTKAPPREDAPPVDIALVAVKSPGTAWAADVASAILSREGVAITLQNGLGNDQVLVNALGRDRTASGVIYVGAELGADGTLRTTGGARVVLGRPRTARRSALAGELAVALRAGGITVDLVDDARPAVWRKLVGNASVNPVTAVLGCANAQLLEHAAGSRMADVLAVETARVATAAGVAISDDDARRMWREMARFTGTNRSSMLQDVLAKRPNEADAINGAVAREGEHLGVPAPLNAAIAVLMASLAPK